MNKEEREQFKIKNREYWRNKIKETFPKAKEITELSFDCVEYTIDIRNYVEPVVRHKKTKYCRYFTAFAKNLVENVKHDREVLANIKANRQERRKQKYAENKNKLYKEIDEVLGDKDDITL